MSIKNSFMLPKNKTLTSSDLFEMYYEDYRSVSKKFLCLLLLASITLLGMAQGGAFMQRDLSAIEVEKLTDLEVKSILAELEKSGLSEVELEQLALANNMPKLELNKLRRRIEAVQGDTVLNSNSIEEKNKYKNNSENLSVREDLTISQEHSRIYGSKLFNNKNLTFEPSVAISPPKDYKLGAGDELIIDIWGASRNYFEKTVDRNGTIRLENVGPVQVSGYTLAQAERKIVNKLSQIYSGLSGGSPNTYAQITLGRLKNIKISIIGEVVSPGTYTLPSLATVFNALYLSGGPSPLGSFRNIEVIRNQRVVATLDIYEFLSKGTSNGNVRLMDQDLIRVPTFSKRIELIGEVKRPGFYEASSDEFLSDLLKYAGGFTKQAYKERLAIERYSSTEKVVIDVAGNERDSFQLNNGDEVKIGSVLDRFENRVSIKGAVFRPGQYELVNGMGVKDLIAKSEGVQASAFLMRAELIRHVADQSTEVISFDLKKLLENTIEDIPLQREDVVQITSVYDLKSKYEVFIEGDVQNPGTYSFYENMSLQSLLLRAGGFVESASVDRVEVARRVTQRESESSDEIAELFQFKIGQDLTIDSEDKEFKLKPFDQVYIRRSPGYEVQKAVYVQGNVQFPGAYVLEKENERISDVVKRAGGLNSFAYAEGAKLVRSYEGKVENMGIDLESILKKPHSSEDLFLLAGDRLVVPKELQTVRINGEVLFPTSAKFEKSKKLKNYVGNAGGYTNNAIRRKTIVRYANGYINSTSSFLGFKFYPKIKPGAEIIIPTRPEKRKITAQEVIGWTTGVATLGLIIVNILQTNP